MFLAVLPHRLFVETSSDIANVSSVEINDKCDVERFRNKRMQQRAPFSSNPQGSTKTPTSKSCKFHRQRPIRTPLLLLPTWCLVITLCIDAFTLAENLTSQPSVNRMHISVSSIPPPPPKSNHQNVDQLDQQSLMLRKNNPVVFSVAEKANYVAHVGNEENLHSHLQFNEKINNDEKNENKNVEYTLIQECQCDSTDKIEHTRTAIGSGDKDTKVNNTDEFNEIALQRLIVDRSQGEQEFFSCGGGPFSSFMASLVSVPCNRPRIHECCEEHDHCYDIIHLNQTYCDEAFCECLSTIEEPGAIGAYCGNFAQPGLCLATKLFGHLFYNVTPYAAEVSDAPVSAAQLQLNRSTDASTFNDDGYSSSWWKWE